MAAKDEEPHVFQETHSDKTSTIGLDEIGWTCRASKQANPRSVMMTAKQAIELGNDVKSSKATMNQTIGSAASVESYKLNQYINHSFYRSTRRHRRRNTSSSQQHSLQEVMRGWQWMRVGHRKRVPVKILLRCHFWFSLFFSNFSCKFPLLQLLLLSLLLMFFCWTICTGLCVSTRGFGNERCIC